MNGTISPEALRQQQESAAAPIVVDVRSEEEYAAGHIPGALHIPAAELTDRLDEIPEGRPVVPY